MPSRVPQLLSSAIAAVPHPVIDIARWAAFGLLVVVTLYTFIGVWPPFASVLSGSMEPALERGDLVLLTSPAAEAAGSHGGIVGAENGSVQNITTYGSPGHVIVFTAVGVDAQYPLIHRAMFWVEEGEDWHARADPRAIVAPNCTALANCPAPNAGFITKGDANQRYDQALRYSTPVPPDAVIGLAGGRIPYLGFARIWLYPVIAVLVLLWFGLTLRAQLTADDTRL